MNRPTTPENRSDLQAVLALLLWIARQKMVWVILGGALGSGARYGVATWSRSHPWGQSFPYGTLVVNVSGSFILALAALLVLPRSEELFLFLGPGFCGGFTTFSTLEWETFRLVQDGSWGLAGINIFGSFAAGFAGVLLGVYLAALLGAR